MPSEDAVIYGLDYPSRALSAVVAETEKICFLVGTQALRAENLIHYLEFDEETNELKRAIYKHAPGEIWQIACAALDRQLFSTVYTKLRSTADGGKPISSNCTIWRLPADVFDGSSHERSLEHVTDVTVKGSNEQPADIHELRWSPNAPTSVLCVASVSLNVVDVERHTCSLSIDVVDSKSVAIATKLTTSRWDPHHNANCVAAAVDTHIKVWDTRSSSKVCYAIENAHAHLVRDVDFNPNRAYVLVSGGDDGRMRVWDVRHAARPLANRADHQHWLFAVRYNHFHDQLILAASSDRRVSLTNLYTLSSEVPTELLGAGAKPADNAERNTEESHTRVRADASHDNGSLVCMYEEHEDSVYAAEWASEPWCFASLSFDGRLCINRVPKAEKYRILL